ncbi:MAG TPA: 3'(2'),5'-bisphosphate nucleotidase CysQ [Acidimicrobiia bacterium]|nr:3'(2'),5'-bisphosphate nucleotidase CysQ [Acidimicrobiia bacterium]
MSDHDDAARYAAAAGELLLDLRAQADGDDWARWSLGDAGDVLANRHLLELLRDEHPDDAVLSEESADDPRRLDAPRVWIIDPLDGTREFTELGRSDWAVHVALWERGRGLTAGAVALPAVGRVLSTAVPPRVPEADGRRPRIVVSRSRAPAAARRVAEALDGDLVYLGSAGAKTMAVVLGEVDAYVHAGGQYEWDSAAPTAVAAAAGLYTSRLDGSPLEYNRPDPWLPDLIVCRPELASRIVAAAAPY